MRELTVPARVSVEAEAALPDAVFEHAAERPDAVAFSRPAAGGWLDVTAAEFARQVTDVARGLVAAGVGAGDRVALMSRSRYEWTLVDYAIWTAGAVTVPVYETSSAEQVQWILADSGAVAAVVETAAHAAVLAAVRPDTPALRHCWQLDAGAVDALTAAGRDVEEAEVTRRRSGLRADDLATVIYTSGTTGRPKGCELTHRNLLFEVLASADGLAELFNPDAATLLFIPPAHIFGRVVQVGAVVNGVRLGHTADLTTLVAELATFRPTFVLSVPRVFEKVYNGARQKARSAGGAGARIFDAADRTAEAYSRALDAGPVPVGLRARHALFDRLVYRRLRAALGGRCTAAISGGAPLGARLGHFFRGVGITVYEGYGLTETTAGGTCNLVDAVRIGSVGRPVPGVSVRIADDGEILLRGDIVFGRYWRDEVATAEAVDPDGWLRTGDVGALDAEGFLTITGRKKEILVTANGKNVAPAVLEDRLRAHPLVSQCVVVGDRQPFVGCLVTIDADAFPAWRQAHGRPADAAVADLLDDPALRAEIQAGIDAANAAVSRAEAIRAFRILPRDFTEAGGELTATLKLRRAVVMKEYAAEVAAIYA